MDQVQRRSPLRLLAPVALVAFVLALALVVTTSSVDKDSTSSGGGDESSGNSEKSGDKQSASDKRESELPSGAYTVKAGDTLAGIADKTGIPVEKLQELNPDLDPQALVSGQKIKLRE